MNQLEIKLNPYQDVNIASLDGLPLSEYSELYNYMTEPFLSWANRLLEVAEREINDDYELIVVAEPFEQLFIKDMQIHFEACISYTAKDFPLATPIEDRYEAIVQLAKKHGVACNTNDGKLNVYVSEGISVSLDPNFTTQTDIENAFLCIMNQKEDVVSYGSATMIVCIGNQSSVTSLGDMHYLWEITPDRLEDIVACIINRFAKVALIHDTLAHFDSIKDTLDSDDMETLRFLEEVDICFRIQNIPDIEVGSEYQLQIGSIPSSNTAPTLRIESSHPSIVSVSGTTLKALSPGTAFIDIYRGAEVMQYDRKYIRVYQNLFAKDIALCMDQSTIGIGMNQQIHATILPTNAEDVTCIEWSVDKPSVATIDHNGQITTHASGYAVICAKLHDVSAEISVNVLPDIASIILSQTAVSLYVGENMPITFDTEPTNCYQNNCIWESSNSSVAIVESKVDNSYVIRATGIGDCILTCKAERGLCEATCHVLVESTFKKREKLHVFLKYTLMCMFATLLCSIIANPFISIITAVATVLCGITAIKRKPSDAFWAIILMGIAILCAFDS